MRKVPHRGIGMQFSRNISPTFILTLLLLASRVPLDAESEKKPTCSVTETPNGILALCVRAGDSFAFDLHKDGNYYIGEWSSQPTGDGIFYELVHDPQSQRCGYHKETPQIGGVRVVDFSKFGSKFDFEDGCPVGRGCPSEGRQSRFGGLGDLRIGHFAQGHLEGLAINLTFEHELTIGLFRQSSLDGEGIKVDTAMSRLDHGIWENDRLVKILSSVKLSPYHQTVFCNHR